MVNERFLGIPIVIWGGLALIVAALFAVVWPQDQVVENAGTLRYIILRWFHTLVWVLIAASLFMRASTVPNKVTIANGLSFAAMSAYLIFLATLLTA